jgi:hypothetical protein
MEKKVNKIEKFLENYQPDFSPFFETRLLAKIESFNNEFKVISLYNRFFSKVLYSGITVIAAILIVIFILNGSLSMDSLLGVKDLSPENTLMISMADF